MALGLHTSQRYPMHETNRWQDDAKCISAPERDKESLTGAHPTREIALDIAHRYCNRCPVILQCLEWAKGEHAFSGIAGGYAFTGEKSAGQQRRMQPIVTGEE